MIEAHPHFMSISLDNYPLIFLSIEIGLERITNVPHWQSIYQIEKGSYRQAFGQESIFVQACRRGQLRILRLLISQGADPN